MRFVIILLIATASAAPAQSARLNVKLDTDAAEAVLAIVKLGSRASERDWQRLFESEGYRRLKQRESAMGRAFTDSSFRAFVLDSALAQRAPRLQQALEAWKQVDVTGAAERAFRYLPANATIRATIYPSIKPRTNTFVFEPTTNPAIFFYLDPDMSAAQFENTLVHELHHLGAASACADDDSEPLAIQWMSGFAEGRAMLAAARHFAVHPHASSPPAERAVWNRDFAKVDVDLRRLEQFFTDIMNSALTEEERNRRGYAFVATDSVPQGAFYTVGYLMAREVERRMGRARLVQSLCDPIMFLADYNAIAPRHRPRWSETFIHRLKELRAHNPQTRTSMQLDAAGWYGGFIAILR